MANIYLEQAELVGRQALCRWNRDPCSPSFGSFDRPHWGWKYKDFPDATLLYATGLALDALGDCPSVGHWLSGFVSFCARFQHSDGSFDQCYPYERTPGVLYDFLSTIIRVHQHQALSGRDRSTLAGVLQRAVTFALSTDEVHGEIANHLVAYAFELLHYGRFANDDRATQRGKRYLERTMTLFVEQEGWFNEYEGPDAGYQTRTLRYLVKCAEILQDESVWALAVRAARFVELLLMPDGSLQPMLGVRSTALLYPSAFEKLARRGHCQALAWKVRAAWREARVPLPGWLDFDNAIRLADDAREAWKAAGPLEEPADEVVSVDMPRAGLFVRRDERRALFVASALGGCVVYWVRQGSLWELRHEDSGYVARGQGAPCLTRLPGNGKLVSHSGDEWTVEVQFMDSRHDDLDWPRMVVLRLLNATFLRVQLLADLFRKLIVRQLMTGRSPRPLHLRREICLGPEGLRLKDTVTGAPRGDLFWGRRLTGVHMATSRYYQEVEGGGQAWLTQVDWVEAGAGTLRSWRD